MTRLGRLWRASHRERWQLLRAWVYVGGVRLGLCAVTLPALQRAFERVRRRHAAPDVEPTLRELRRDAWAVRVASAYVPRANTCLVQALALQLWLARRGHASNLRIGVAPAPDMPIQAHAWLECHGAVLIGGNEDLDRYAVLEPSPAAESSAPLERRPRP